jgi:hypothetical protein
MGKRMEELTPQEVIRECNDLKSFWLERNNKFKEWWELLRLVDKLKQEGMESFVSSDPRASINLATQLLISKPIPHRVDQKYLPPEQIDKAEKINSLLQLAWNDIEKRYSGRGRRSWLRDLSIHIVGLGWYSVLSTIDDTGANAYIWHPAEVFPEWDDEQMIRCAHIYSISNDAVRIKASRNGWDRTKVPYGAGRYSLYDYWKIEDEAIWHCIVYGGNFLVRPTIESYSRIPIFVGAVGGLPDTGQLNSKTWTADFGQSILAPSEPVYNNYNKQWTYRQQILRDTANPRWFERSRSGSPIMQEKDVFRRGAIFRGSPEDSIEPIGGAPIPVEARADSIDMEAMLQRSGPSWQLFGAGTSGMSAYVMSQVASSAEQYIGPYHEGLIGLLEDIDNFWLNEIWEHGYKPYKTNLYNVRLPSNVDITAKYEITVPGNVIQKATVSRMLNPNFELSESTIYDLLWTNEVPDVTAERSRIRSEKAMHHQIMTTVSTISYLKQEAIRLAKTDRNAAELLNRVIQNFEATILPQQQSLPAQAQSLSSMEQSLGVSPQNMTSNQTGTPSAPGVGNAEMPPSMSSAPGTMV